MLPALEHPPRKSPQQEGQRLSLGWAILEGNNHHDDYIILNPRQWLSARFADMIG
jgi:hypothetical protein